MRLVAAQRAVRTVVGVEQHRQDRRTEAIGSVRDERRRHDGTELRQERGRILDLELPMRRLVHGATISGCGLIVDGHPEGHVRGTTSQNPGWSR